MLVSDIVRTCTHGSIAAAAVASIGGEFAASIRRRAIGEGVSVGEFTAGRVRLFSGRASERERARVAACMEGQDLALLCGLELVVTAMMAEETVCATAL